MNGNTACALCLGSATKPQKRSAWSQPPNPHFLQLVRLLQEIYEQGLFHPSVTTSITTPLFTNNFSTAAVLQQNASIEAGYVCTCGQFYNNPCRMEIRSVSVMHFQTVCVAFFPLTFRKSNVSGGKGPVFMESGMSMGPSLCLMASNHHIVSESEVYGLHNSALPGNSPCLSLVSSGV